MGNSKFKKLIIDAYNNSKKERTLVGIMYGPISNYSFNDIVDIQGFVNNTNADMLYLKSLLTGIELDIYAYDLVDYKISSSEHNIYIKLRNKEVVLKY